MRKFRENKGITLIALIITIVVLLIIAGISISGGISGVEQVDNNRLITEFEKVQHAVTERYTKYKLTKDASLLAGTKIELTSLTDVPTSIKWKVYQFTESSNPEREYYRLSTSNLIELGLTGGTDEYKGSSYIVNYYSGEVYDEVQKQTSNGTVLYKAAIENEASELGDDYIKDGMQVWYDGINNTGSGHSSSTKIWFDLSGNGNDATLHNFDTTPTEESGWHSNYLAFDGVDDFAEKTGVTINGANGTIEIVGKYISGTYIFRSNSSDLGTYIRGINTTKGSMPTNVDFNTTNYYNLSSRVLKYYTENNTSYTLNYYNMTISGEPQVYQSTNNGDWISMGSFVNANWDQGTKLQVYAVRLYNRGLSEDEIHHNYILDKARYGIEE